MGAGVALIDSARETAQEVLTVIGDMNLAAHGEGRVSPAYYVTDAPDRFMRLGSRFLGTAVEEVNQVEV